MRNSHAIIKTGSTQKLKEFTVFEYPAVDHQKQCGQDYTLHYIYRPISVEARPVDYPSHTPFQIPTSIALICSAMWVEWNRHIARFPIIYHNPGTPNALYVYIPFSSPSEFTPQIGLIFAIKDAFSDADRTVVRFSFGSPIL
jgi:hypothetical protein